MDALLASKTVQLALVFAALGVAMIIFDTTMGVLLGYQVRYVPELFALLTAMFAALAGKNLGDNYFAYQREKTTIMAGTVPPNAPPQPVVP